MQFDLNKIRSILANDGQDSARFNTFEQALRNIQGSNETTTWRYLSQEILKKSDPHELHLYLYHETFRNWDPHEKGPAPAWVPSDEEIKTTNIYYLIQSAGRKNHQDLHIWSLQNREAFWQKSLEKIGLHFKKSYQQLLDLSGGAENPIWLKEAQLNIADSCFLADSKKPAIVFQKERGDIQSITYGDLNNLSNRVANGLKQSGFKRGDAIAVDMVMTAESVAIYLGIVKAGCVVVSIADSFAPEEIKTRLRIADAKGIFTQDFIFRGGKQLPLYDKIVSADAPKAIVLPCGDAVEIQLRNDDVSWGHFLSDSDVFESLPCDPSQPTNILFSSGTTGDPKAIPWTHLTPIKSAVDGHFHHDIQQGDVVAWPTNLGWMMGPWLIYATLINKGTMALYYGVPTGREFGEFIQSAKVNMLGLVPSLVKTWKSSNCMNDLDWSSIKLFSSTGECSNADDYLYLMSLANYRPVIEYCGGTEIGGGFLTGTLVQPASPATFSTPALGIDVRILDENNLPTENGELYLVPPSIGLSQTLLNRDHHQVYYEGTPLGPSGEVLRRHGDQIERLGQGYYRALGRADDTMNLGGIKVSSAEIERVLNQVAGVRETAAIAISPAGGGPSLLVVYVVLQNRDHDIADLKIQMQKSIKESLNPLFKIHDLIAIDSLPRTASNKVMRRVLRDRYTQPS